MSFELEFEFQDKASSKIDCILELNTADFNTGCILLETADFATGVPCWNVPSIHYPPLTLYGHDMHPVTCHKFMRFCLNPINLRESTGCMPCPYKVRGAILHGAVWKCYTECILRLKLELETHTGTEPCRMHLFKETMLSDTSNNSWMPE